MSKRLYSMLCDIIDHTYAASSSEQMLKKYKGLMAIMLALITLFSAFGACTNP